MQNNYPTNCDARGIAAGQYYQFPVGSTVVAASQAPSYQLSSTSPGLGAILDTISLPGGMVGPDGWFELWLDWSCSNSANNKTMQVWLDWSATHCDDVQTTVAGSTMLIRICNRGNTSINMFDGSGTIGGSTAANIATTADLSAEGHTLSLHATLANSADVMRVERWMLTAHNPPVYSTARVKYGTQMFYGANAHFDDSQSIAMHIAGLKTMGMKTMRIAWEGNGSMPQLIAYAQAFKADNTGLQLLVCLDFGMSYATEAAAYAGTFASVFPVVQTLAALGVTMFECGNEMDTKAGINIGDPQGGRPSDFSNSLVPIFRGTQRGAIDAIHAVDPNLIAGSNAYTVCSIALADMMWYGTQPDGTSGYPPVRWDVTCWHNYEDYGPLVGVEMGFQRPWVNILQYANRRYGGRPIFITEWNAKASDTDAQRAAWATRMLYDLYNNRYKYNIGAIFVYEMYGSPWHVLDDTLNTPISTFGTTVQSFISSNPDTGT